MPFSNGAHDAIISTDQHLKIREFNPAAERMFGYTRMSILGKGIEMLMPPSLRERQLQALDALSDLREWSAGGSADRDPRLCRADGRVSRSSCRWHASATSARRCITGFVRDITERRALEEQLRQSQKLEAVGRLASGVAHDFNNILMSILGSADLMLMQLRRRRTGPRRGAEIKVSVQRGAGLTRQLLAFSRRQATSPRLIALEDVVDGMDMMLRRLIGTEVDLEIVQRAPPTLVIADPAQLEQVILNLVINARDAMPTAAV